MYFIIIEIINGKIYLLQIIILQGENTLNNFIKDYPSCKSFLLTFTKKKKLIIKEIKENKKIYKMIKKITFKNLKTVWVQDRKT